MFPYRGCRPTWCGHLFSIRYGSFHERETGRRARRRTIGSKAPLRRAGTRIAGHERQDGNAGRNSERRCRGHLQVPRQERFPTPQAGRIASKVVSTHWKLRSPEHEPTLASRLRKLFRRKVKERHVVRDDQPLSVARGRAFATDAVRFSSSRSLRSSRGDWTIGMTIPAPKLPLPISLFTVSASSGEDISTMAIGSTFGIAHG